jgi:SAM-dependent methyltransferase
MTTEYDAVENWESLYTDLSEIAYPAEGVIRIFKGKFPHLNMPTIVGGDVLDLGCGDGRHIRLLSSVGLNVSATEISDKICQEVIRLFNGLDVVPDIRTGTAAVLPFPSKSFDYLLTWNSCYYMSADDLDFKSHVYEMARVLKHNGWMICSVPKKDNFIFKGSVETREGYRTIREDYFGTRNGEIMRCFSSRMELELEFDSLFHNFSHADIDLDWFGLDYKWHIVVAQRKEN